MSRIIVGVDLSEECERAIAHAVAIGRRTGAELVLVLADAVPDPIDGPPEAMRIIVDRYTATLASRLEEHRRRLAALRARWVGHGVELSQLVIDGFAAERLPAVAAELGAQLIVVGSHGRSGVKRFLLGSIAEQLTRRADRSVLVARGDAPDGGYRRVVIGTDLSTPAEEALRHAVPLIAHGGHVDLVHCWQALWFSVFGEPIPVEPDDDVYRALGQSLDDLAARVRATVLRDRPDVDVTPLLIAAPPAQGLVEAAATLPADLLVVGSHGRRGVRRLVLGSVAEVAVRRAACSVLVTR